MEKKKKKGKEEKKWKKIKKEERREKKMEKGGKKKKKTRKKEERRKKNMNYVANVFTQLGFISWLKKKCVAKKHWKNYVAKKGSLGQASALVKIVLWVPRMCQHYWFILFEIPPK